MRILAGSSIVLAASLAYAAPAKLVVRSNAFASGDTIPVQYTCDGAGKAPQLEWSAAPAGTRSIAILVDDTDAANGPFTHAIVTGLPASQTTIDLGGAQPAGVSLTRNDTETVGYLAPCPEDGRHHYHYRVFALDAPVRTPRLTGVVSRAAFLRGIEGHVLAQGELVGVYESR